LDAWFTPKRFALLLLAFLLAAFPDVLLLGKSFFFRDYAFFTAPFTFYQKECFWRGELPFWNAYHNLGHPFLAQWNTMALYPGSLIYLLLPLPWSLNLFCLAHLFLGAMGMYFFARHLLNHSFAASFVGLAYIFNAFTLNCLMYPHNIAALSWLPWILWGTVLACRNGGRALPLAMLAGAMQMLTGGAEITLQTWILAGCFVLFDCWQNGWHWKAPLRLLVIVLVVTALCAVQLLPFLDLLSHSQRDMSWASDAWSMPAWGWLNLFVPKFGSYPGPHGVYNQFGQAWVNTYYPGCIISLLALLTWWNFREKLILGCWLVIALSLAIAQGGEGILLAKIKVLLPQLGYIRYPVKFIAMTIVLLPLMAGAGLRTAMNGSTHADETTLPRKLFLLGFLLVFLAALAARLDLYLQIPFVVWETTLINGLIRVPIFAFAAYLLVRLLKTPVAGNALKISLALMSLIWADQIIFNHRPSPTVKSWVYKPKMAQDQLGIDVPSGPGAPRFLPNAQIMAELGGTAFVIPEEQVAYCRMACFDNLTLFDHLPKLHGFFPMDLRSFQEILPWFHVMPDEEVRPLIEFAGMAYTQRPGKPIEWIKKWNPQPLITAGQKPVAVETGGVFTLLQEGRFKPTEEVYLYPSWANDLQDVVSGQASIEAIDWREQSIRFKVNAAKPSIVVLAQTYYHPWVARIGDTVVPLRRANHSFTALKVPAGSHQVVLTYEDPKFRLGLVITGFACLVVIVLLTVTFKKKPQLPAV
jgi:hypothetical protein